MFAAALLVLGLHVTAPDTIVPGHPLLRNLKLRLGTDTTEVFSVINGTQRRMNSSIQTVAALSNAYLVTHYSATSAGPVIDSTWVDRETFATQRHIFISPGDTKRLDFRGRQVTGTHTDSSGAHPVDITLQSDALDNSIGGIIAAALPPRDGFSAVLATYDVGGQYSFMTVRTLGGDTLTHAGRVVRTRKLATDFAGGGRAWTVMHWLDEKDSRDLRWELSIQGRGMLGIARP